ncbi:MAG: hypothetical protein QMB67_09715 [Sulfurospirillum sp.]|jgi:hypothetical protein|uniref:hypothetical protein n=1 Tax=Sulfurospirillum sp. UCH001 TaxID=1581011 RepID=UPI0008301A27|nr:hypothetical protein [Sulfurospirillum sp. UCH001]
MISRYESINTYLNRGIIEANIAYAKMHQSSFSMVKFGFDVDLEDAFFFKDLIAFIHTELGFHTLLQQGVDTFVIILRDIKIHHAKKVLKKLEHNIKQTFKIEIKNIGITLFDATDSYKSLLDRLDKYYVMSRLSTRKKIFYGTLDFDFYETQNKNDVLASILRKEKTVTLHNLYNGIPIKEEATIAKFDEGIAQLKITTPKIFYYTKESFTFIQHDKIPSIIKAKIIKVDPSKSLVVLANLEFLDASPLDRSYIRVQPQKPINATLLLNKIKLLDGTLETISESSVVLHVKLTDIEKIIHKDLTERDFEIAFQIPTEKGFLTMISAKASIFSIINETIVINMQPNTFMKSKLKQYVALRQNALLVDLRQQLKHMS